MEQTIKIRLGGVPEHYNLPIHLAIENDEFIKEGIECEWIDFPGGTGDMTRSLRNNETDLCILLTEGILTDIIKGSPAKIVSGYVKTALTWGIHTQESNTLHHEDIFDKKFAVSRFGSGSHLMPIVDALLRNKLINTNQFVEIGNMQGAIDSLRNKETEVFYWEKFTTKPFLTKGAMKRIDDFVSPWPCFLIAATDQFILANPDVLAKTLRIIQKACAAFMKLEHAHELVYQRYNIELKDAERWFHSTEWAVDGWVSNKMLDGVHYILKEANIVDADSTTEHVIWDRNKKA